jgi:catechol 2,3-dioxygenase-like lactoylglutathione lyase family enzyme
MDQRVSLITLGVADLDRSLRFYEALGWKRGNADDGVVFFQLPGFILALWSRAAIVEDAGVKDGGGFGGIALAYNARSRADADTVVAEAKAAGARVLKALHETFWGGYSGYFADPDGHVWEVAFNPGWSIDAAGRVSLAPPSR